MPDPLADLEQLAARVGDIAEDDQPNATSLLRYASSLVRAHGNRAWENPAEAPEELADVVVGMVERAVRNPGGVTQDTTGPFTVSYGPDAAARIYLTKGDRIIIRSAAGNGAFTVDPVTDTETIFYLGEQGSAAELSS